jgi:hypothetical protein
MPLSFAIEFSDSLMYVKLEKKREEDRWLVQFVVENDGVIVMLYTPHESAADALLESLRSYDAD